MRSPSLPPGTDLGYLRDRSHGPQEPPLNGAAWIPGREVAALPWPSFHASVRCAEGARRPMLPAGGRAGGSWPTGSRSNGRRPVLHASPQAELPSSTEAEGRVFLYADIA